ncbi:MAG: sigma-70 family RNA polymerase sigma factor [Clostridium sp.]|uniref:RNA polymerase sigma factor n=1 Tax=Clostridium sp. TaxID=1506 RepID=UPI0025BA2019|nr:sigma-70 family RNA polymerase sigma factor [Clostridium sp.]MCH3963903.1 sigma-70 family RNA polymerase sigma factor [Clostridium sp.]MCI1716104.1 sigma-70 family RNA polymerase sigma factor [Clostridium sp.]MCI1800656.1 sigma-70 family RNA polymerase sigma factor [Clostridium sp.]MCI1814281.1 sigma-70 family RNA polymerase sigma factor [Clostridium sp.]MCI1871180.1 sigma-70 family RNA polymerase sigma factor [Clostridium sp.]
MNKDTFIVNVLKAESTLYHISKSILIHEQDCEDAVQETILKAYNKLYTLKKEQYFKTWLVRILINECYCLKRKECLRVPYEEYFESAEANDKEDYSELYLAIQNLPERIRITIVLYYVEGYSVEEIKEILEIPAGTVKSRLARGRKLLKIKLEDMEVNYE